MTMGRAAAEQLFARLAGSTLPPRQIIFPTRPTPLAPDRGEAVL